MSHTASDIFLLGIRFWTQEVCIFKQCTNSTQVSMEIIQGRTDLHENSSGLSSQPIPSLGVSHPVPAQALPI